MLTGVWSAEPVWLGTELPDLDRIVFYGDVVYLQPAYDEAASYHYGDSAYYYAWKDNNTLELRLPVYSSVGTVEIGTLTSETLQLTLTLEDEYGTYQYVSNVLGKVEEVALEDVESIEQALEGKWRVVHHGQDEFYEFTSNELRGPRWTERYEFLDRNRITVGTSAIGEIAMPNKDTAILWAIVTYDAESNDNDVTSTVLYREK